MKIRVLVMLMILCMARNGYTQLTMQWNIQVPLDSTWPYFANFTTAFNSQSNLVLGSVEFYNDSIYNLDPVVTLYDQAGNSMLSWANKDSNFNEVNTSVQFDSLGFIYITTEGFNSVTNSAVTSLVKINSITGLEEFRITVPASFDFSKFLLVNDFIYLIQPFPENLIYKIDLQGNIVHTSQLSTFFKFQDFLSDNGKLYIIGDSISGANWQLKFQILDTGCVSNHVYTTTFINDYYGDAIIGSDGVLTYAFGDNNGLEVVQFDSLFNYWDTTIAVISGSEALAYDNMGRLYLAYGDQNFETYVMNLSRLTPSVLMFSIDSVHYHNNFKIDLFVEQGYFILFNSSTIVGSPNAANYYVNLIDYSGNIIDRYSLDNKQLDFSRRMYISNGSIYCVGLQNDLNELSVGLFRLNYVVGIHNNINYSEEQVLNLYPNPTNTRTVKFSEIIEGVVEIYSINGQLIQSLSLQNENQMELPENLVSGCYLIHIISNKVSSTIKLNYYEE